MRLQCKYSLFQPDTSCAAFNTHLILVYMYKCNYIHPFFRNTLFLFLITDEQWLLMIWRHQSRLPSKDLSEFFRLVKLRKVNTMAKMAFYKAKKKIEPELKRLLQQYNEKIELQNRNYFRAHHSLPPNNDSHDLKSFNLLKKFLSLE